MPNQEFFQQLFGDELPERRWIDIMREGQSTRDPSLRTRSEVSNAKGKATRLRRKRSATG